MLHELVEIVQSYYLPPADLFENETRGMNRISELEEHIYWARDYSGSESPWYSFHDFIEPSIAAVTFAVFPLMYYSTMNRRVELIDVMPSLILLSAYLFFLGRRAKCMDTYADDCEAELAERNLRKPRYQIPDKSL